MSASTRILPFGTTRVQKAITALGRDLSDPMAAICDHYGLGCGTGVALVAHRLTAACHGVYIVDELGADIPLALNALFVLPPGAGQIVLQGLADQLALIETETAPEAIGQLARSAAAVQLRVEHRKQIEAAIKGATRKMVRLQALLAQRRELEACEPQEGHYPEHLSAMVAWNQRLSDFDFSIDQGELESDAETVRALRTARKALLAEPPSSFEADHRRWKLKRSAVDAQIVLLQGADEEVAHLVGQKEALLAADASTIKPAMPRLLYWNTSVAEVRKAISSGWPAAVAMYAGEAVVKTLAKHRTALADACGGRLLSAHPPGRVQLNVIATVTPAAFVRDMKAIGAEGAAALGAMFVITADMQQADFDILNKRPASDSPTVFESRLKMMIVEKMLALQGEGFQASRITVSPEAASLAAAQHEMLRTTCMHGERHPALDAFLMRARTMYHVIAGLLHVWRRETGPLSLRTMQDAVDIGDYLIENFERTVMMAREVPAEEVDAQGLFRALCGHVREQIEKKSEFKVEPQPEPKPKPTSERTAEPKPKPEPGPFVIRLATLHVKAKSFGLTRARVNGALKVLVEWGWIKVRQEGLDTVFDLDPHRFGPTNRFY